MQDEYYLIRRQGWICRAAAVLFALAATINAAAAVIPIALTGTPAIEWRCGPAGCAVTEQPAQLLPEADRREVSASRAATQRFGSYAQRTDVRIGLGAIGLFAAAPLIVLLLGVSAAMWRLGARHGEAVARALPWLRRAAVAALCAALAPPIADSLAAMLLLPGTPSGPGWYLALDIGPFLTRLLLAFAAFIVTWALMAGNRARTDLAKFV